MHLMIFSQKGKRVNLRRNSNIKLRFLEEMSLVQEAVSKAFAAQKMNVELLGNGDAHAHWHIFPRREGDMKGHGLNGRGPVWWVHGKNDC